MGYNTDDELIGLVVRKLKIPRQEAKEITAVVMDSMRECLIMNTILDIRKFGKFTLRSRKNSLVRNPSTGVSKRLPLMYYVGFNAAHSLKAEINVKARDRMKKYREP